MLEVACPVCSKRISVHEKHVGKKAKCPICDTFFEVTRCAALPESLPPASAIPASVEKMEGEPSVNESWPASGPALGVAILSLPGEDSGDSLSELQAATDSSVDDGKTRQPAPRLRSTAAVMWYLLIFGLLGAIFGGVVILEIVTYSHLPVAPAPTSAPLRTQIRMSEKLQVFCVAPVSNEQGEACGRLLQQGQWSGVVELRQVGQRYQLRFLPSLQMKGVEPAPLQLAQMAAEWSRQSLGGAATEVHLCDEQFVTRKILDVVETSK